LAGKPQPDLLLLNDEDLTFAKIRLDDRSKQTVISAIGEIKDSLARTLIWGAAWDMTRDGEMSTGDYVALVNAGLATENDVAVVQTILRQVHAAVDQYAAPEHRDQYASALADNLWAWAQAADPGSDHQLAFVRGLAAMAQTPEQLQIVADLLNGDRTLAGLTVDTDLRWGLLQSLAAAGLADAERIEEEAQADATATGRRHRAMALASLPTAAAKADAWAAIMGGELPNALLDATLGGFSRAGQAEILAPYIPQYFEQLPTIWQERTPEMAQSITMLLYPYLAVSESTAEAAEAFAAGADVHPAAARLVGEGADSTRRALRARAVDAD
nr:ERAP1-like C-terminal domain-containing protein [Actinomycetes bacterium]